MTPDLFATLLMHPSAPLLRGLCFVAALMLLWLGGEVSSAARPRASQPGVGAGIAAAVLVALALWWPGQFVGATRAAPGPPGIVPLLSGLLATAAAYAGRSAALRLMRKPRLRFAGPLLATFIASALYSGLATSVFETLTALTGPAGACGALLLLVAALIGIHLHPKSFRLARTWRLLSVPVIALIVTVCAEPPAGHDLARPLPWADALPIGFVVLLSQVLLNALVRVRKSSGRSLVIPPADPPAVDALTQLPTRAHFERKLGSAMRKCDDGKRRLALLFIDLDGFKPVNDTYGHRVGDAVLKQVGRRLQGMSRGRDIVARVGGDEFLLLLSQVDSDETVENVAKRVIEGLSQSYAVEQRDVTISCSVGIAFYPADCSLVRLISRADAAMYAAKRAGGSTHCFFEPSMEVDTGDGFELLNDLRKALAGDELELYYQPKIDAKSGKVTAAEALLRWNHPTRGQLTPNLFIPLAERSGLITALGNWVIEDACRQGRVWRNAGLRMRVAINLSPLQMRREGIVAEIAGALERHRIHPSLLTCEITESVAMEDTKSTQETFRQLGELGTHLSIDDFGTGYSSLSYLRQLPAEELKIDRSFIMDLQHSADARAVVDAVVKLAHALGLKVVAEGVDNEQQRQILVELGCDELQGYLFAKPMSARALLLWAVSDGDTKSAAFRASLFGETKQV